jgi:hypothetical protein
MLYNIEKLETGTKVIASIKGVKIEDAALFNVNGKEFYICHNNSNFSGSKAPDLLGYVYSWIFYKEDNRFSDQVEILGIYNKPKKDAYFISDELSSFLNKVELPAHTLSFIDIMPEYKRFEVSENKGLVKLTNLKDKKVEIKFGRFINSFLTQIKETPYRVDFDNIKVENLHNKYLSLQKGEILTVEILSGNDILYAYNSNNYYITKQCNLVGSCMSNKFNYLKMYINNADTIKLVCIKTFNRVIGRALLWTTNDGTQILDKQYVAEDWLYQKYLDICKENGYLLYNQIEKNYDITVNLSEVEEFPYLDTFMYCKYDKNENSKLSNYSPIGNYFIFRSTIGGYEEY